MMGSREVRGVKGRGLGFVEGVTGSLELGSRRLQPNRECERAVEGRPRSSSSSRLLNIARSLATTLCAPLSSNGIARLA